MNPQTHRLIFNKTRGCWMAVGAMDTRHVEKSTYSRSLMWQKTESEG